MLRKARRTREPEEQARLAVDPLGGKLSLVDGQTDIIRHLQNLARQVMPKKSPAHGHVSGCIFDDGVPELAMLSEHGLERRSNGPGLVELWEEILNLAQDMTEVWSKATTLGTAARYIIKHFDTLTAYLDDPVSSRQTISEHEYSERKT